MGLDIRWPMGLLFLLLGAILAGYGVLSDPAIYARSLGLNVNLWWGAVLLVSGVVMVALARRARP
ncbi:hypothetical protein [Luteitalea sp.]|uniref:hypothetical protein n=1 Tax=Luteitalea sp. TaxID=2004800 RepID=UPI0025C042D0|nr:hypothetical protein [Luteitalea sp.]